MNTVLLVCAIFLTITIGIAVIILAMALLQVKRTAREAQILLQNINRELSAIGRITGNISAFVDRIASPWTRVGGWVTGIASSLFLRRKKRSSAENAKEKVGI